MNEKRLKRTAPVPAVPAKPAVYTIEVTETELKVLWHKMNACEGDFTIHYKEPSYDSAVADLRAEGGTVFELWKDLNNILGAQ